MHTCVMNLKLAKEMTAPSDLIHGGENPRVLLLFARESQHPTRRITTTNGDRNDTAINR